MKHCQRGLVLQNKSQAKQEPTGRNTAMDNAVQYAPYCTLTYTCTAQILHPDIRDMPFCKGAPSAAAAAMQSSPTK
jgi:hypothetical protein